MKISLFEYKKHLIDKIEDIKLNKLKSSIDNLRNLLNILESLGASNMLDESKPGNLTKLTSGESDGLKPDEFVFKKSLLGGYVENIDNSWLPESFIREMNLQSGDIVEISNKKDVASSIKVTKKSDSHVEEDFVLYRFCEVKLDDSILYVDESLYGGEQLIKIDEVPYKYVVTSDIANKFKINEGDLIDIGYDKSNPRVIKVVWKHSDNFHITPQNSSVYKEKENKKYNPVLYGIDFKESKILVVGCEPRKRYYKEAVELCNGSFIFSNGEEKIDRLLSLIDNADVVLLLKDFLSHAAVNQSVDHCKETNKAFKVVDGLGIQTVIFEIRKLVATSEE